MTTTKGLVDKLPDHERGDVRELAENVLFMRAKLKETRRDIAKQKLVIPYDNGGGQTGIRANPAFGEYQKMLNSYRLALSDLRGILAPLAKAEQDDGAQESNPLADILDEANRVLADAR